MMAIDKNGANTAVLAELNTGSEAVDCIKVRQNRYLKNLVEQDRRNIKRWIRQMMGFKLFRRAQKYWPALS